MQRSTTMNLQPADRNLLINGLTLIALGVSVLILNSWNQLFVRTLVGLFWGTFILVLNWSDVVYLVRDFRQSNGGRQHSSQ
jgi:hypothetical protein